MTARRGAGVQKKGSNYLFLILFVVFLVLAYFIVKPFITAVLASVILAYAFYPVFQWLNKRLPSRGWCAAIISLLLVLVLVVPITFLVDDAASEARFLYLTAKQKITTGNLFSIDCADNASALCRLSETTKGILSMPDINIYLQDAIGKGTAFVINKTSDILLGLPVIIMQVALTFFFLFYLFKDGPAFAEAIKRLLPLTKEHADTLFQRFDEVTYAVLYGTIVVAIIQGALLALGFIIFGIPSPLLWGLVGVVLAIIPIVGPSIIWIPTSVGMIISGASTANTMLVWKGILFLVYGVAIISSVDNFLKPKIIGDRAKLHPAIVLIGALGGIALFGMVGFLIGPVVLAGFLLFLETRKEHTHIL